MADIFIPQVLDGLGPVGNLLNLVLDEHCPLRSDLEPGRLPLLLGPGTVAKGRLVGRCIVAGKQFGLLQLPGHCGLACLTRSGKHLNKPARLLNPRLENSKIMAV